MCRGFAAVMLHWKVISMIRRVGWLATFISSVPTAVLIIALVLGTFIPVGTLEPAQKPGFNNQTITSLNTSGSVVVNNFA